MSADERKHAAVGWFVRLHTDDVTAATRQDHQRWLAEDKENHRLYQDVLHAMRDTSGLDDWMHAEVTRLNHGAMARQARRTKGWIASLATAAAMVAAVAYWMLRDPEVVFETARAEQREISLEDGSRIHLNASSAVVVRYTAAMREVHVTRGEGVFDIDRDENRPFVATAADAKVVVVGTQFRVRLNASKVTVTVLEGTVAVSSGTRSTQQNDQRVANTGNGSSPADTALLNANDQITVAPGGGLSQVETVDAFVATAWREGKLIFDETPLRQVIGEISRHSRMDIIVSDDVPDHPITGLIHIRSTDSMLGFIAGAVPVTPVQATPNAIVLHANP